MLDTIQKLEDSGYITSKNAIDAKKEFVFSNQDLLKPDNLAIQADDGITLTEYITLSNIMKLLAIIALLIAFRGLVMKFIVWFIKIPQVVYQTILLIGSLTLTFIPEVVWASEAYYLSIFGVIANIIILGWISMTYTELVEKISKLFSLGINPQIIMFFYATIYFGFFAIYIDSWLLGIIATITFIGMFTFTMETTGVYTFIGYEHDDFIFPGLITSLSIITVYSFITINGIIIPYLDIFSIGIEYVLTIVATISLVILTSFMFQNDKTFGLSVFLFILAFIGANLGGILYGLEVLPAIINTGFFLFILGWLHYFTFKISGIFTMFVTAITLYGSALMLEAYPEYFVTSLF